MSKAKTSTIFDDKLEMINLDDIEIVHPGSENKPPKPANLNTKEHGTSYAKVMKKHHMKISDYFDNKKTPSDDRWMELLKIKKKIIVITYPENWFIHPDIIRNQRSDGEDVESGLESIEDAIVEAGFAKYREYKRNKMKMKKYSKKKSKKFSRRTLNEMKGRSKKNKSKKKKSKKKKSKKK